MKNLAILFSTLALLGVIALFGLRMSDKPSKNDTKETTKEQITDTKGRVAFVNIDSLQEQYEYFATEKKKFEARQESMVKELESSSQKFQQDLMAAQRKAEANAMTQAEYESTAKKLDQMRMSLERREKVLSEQFAKEQEAFNKDLEKRVDEFLADYNKDKQFDYILSYSKAMPIFLYGNEQLDITADVIAGMNERYKKEPAKDSKDEKKKNK